MQRTLRVVMLWLLTVSNSVISHAQEQQDVPDIGHDWRDNVSSSDIVKTTGFWQGQQLTLERIRTTLPELARQASIRSLELEAAFGPAIDKMNEYARSKTSDWDEFVTQSRDRVASGLLDADITLDQGEAYLLETEGRLRGQMVSPVREIILAFHPEYRDNPARELADGMKIEYSSKGLDKAGDLQLSMHHPASWKNTPGRLPHVVSTFRSDAGHGGASCLILVRKLKPDEELEWTEQTLRELSSREGLARDQPSAHFLEAGTTTLAGQFATWTKYQLTQESIGIHAKLMGQTYNLQYDAYYISLQLFVSVTRSRAQDLPTDKEMEALFRKYDVLFRLMTLSFEILNRFTNEAAPSAKPVLSE